MIHKEMAFVSSRDAEKKKFYLLVKKHGREI